MARLEDIFRELSGQSLIMVSPGGNWGDYLIYSGAEALAKRCSVQARSITHLDFLSQNDWAADAIYLHGSGGFNPWTSGNALKIFEHALLAETKTVIQGPQTIADDATYVAKVAGTIDSKSKGKTVHFFARENLSHTLLRTAFTESRVEIHLDHDTAFHNTISDLLPDGPPRPRYELLALREDNEKTGREKYVKGSNASDAAVLDPARYAVTFDHWIRIHALSRTIRTNRTHSAILGAILGKQTTLFASSSHKNHSIWEYSLESRGVHWLDASDANSPSETSSIREKQAEHKTNNQDARYDPRRLIRPFYKHLNLPRARAQTTDTVSKLMRRLDHFVKGVPLR